MVIKYTNIYHSKDLQILPKLEFSVWKQTISQPWSEPYVSVLFILFYEERYLNVDESLLV
jgi:hypothetical protein